METIAIRRGLIIIGSLPKRLQRRRLKIAFFVLARNRVRQAGANL
jgi:hypothetical protein